MKNTLHTFAAALMLLAVAGIFSAKPAMAQARPTLVQNTDEPARAPFQAVVNLNYATNTLYVSVPIPSGKRLVIDYVSVNGAAASPTGNIQPYVILSSSVAGSPSATYFLPQTQSPLATTQFSSTGPVTIYSDTLAVSFGYAGFTPNFANFTVSISGHLVAIVAS
jgi:hypothetical protein